MNVIETARTLGKALQEDERYIKYDAATKASDTDTQLQNKIGDAVNKDEKSKKKKLEKRVSLRMTKVLRKLWS